MIAEKIKYQMRRGLLEYCVLQILSKKEGYASDLIEELQKVNLLSVEGIIYPLLVKFKQEGLVNYEWENSEGGLPKKNYQLTEEGKKTAEQLKQEFKLLIGITNGLNPEA